MIALEQARQHLETLGLTRTSNCPITHVGGGPFTPSPPPTVTPAPTHEPTSATVHTAPTATPTPMAVPAHEGHSNSDVGSGFAYAEAQADGHSIPHGYGNPLRQAVRSSRY